MSAHYTTIPFKISTWSSVGQSVFEWAFILLAIGFESWSFQRKSTCQLTTKTCISPEPGAKANRQWSQVGWMLTHHRGGLLSSRLFLSHTSQLRILYSAKEDNLSLLNSKIACLCQRIKIIYLFNSQNWISSGLRLVFMFCLIPYCPVSL